MSIHKHLRQWLTDAKVYRNDLDAKHTRALLDIYTQGSSRESREKLMLA